MQLRFLLIGLLMPLSLLAQTYRPLEEKEVNILFDYYQQDGNHSPVTGGLGTEKLDCIAPLMTVNVPFDSVHNINVSFGIDYYSSASCNNIDRYLTSASKSDFVSSASAQDVRSHGDISYTRKLKNRRSSIGSIIGFSKEFDVTSISGGLNYTRTSKDGNREFALKGSLYYDNWLLIFPGELRKADVPNFIDPTSGNIIGWGDSEDRNGVSSNQGNTSNLNEGYDSDQRYTTTFTASYAQVLTRKLQMFVTTDVVFQNGILWTPFHRVYFDDVTTKILPTPENYWSRYVNHEYLPNHKIKIPVGLRLNYYLTDWATIRLFYRYYWDDFDMTSNTVSLEVPLKVNSWLTISPMYRYYQQTACKYFRPFGEHKLLRDSTGNPIEWLDGLNSVMPNTVAYQSQEQYFTSDYDLSALTNHKFSIAARISPTYGIKKWKVPTFGLSKRPEVSHLAFKFIEIRVSYYERSDGLTAISAGFNTGFTF